MARDEAAGRLPAGGTDREARALLRAHLTAAGRGGHLSRHCAVCHRLLRLALEGRGRR